MKRILATLLVLASTSSAGIASATYYDDRYDSRYDDRYYSNDYYYQDSRHNDDWYDDRQYEDSRYNDRYQDDWYYSDEYHYRSSSSKYRNSPSMHRRATVSKSKTIEIRSGDFRPETITVKAGTTVTWVNRDHMPHTVRSHQRGLFSSTKFYEGQRYSVTFLYPGTFEYHCSQHPGMVGTVRVIR